MKQLIISSYDFPYCLNIALFVNGKAVDMDEATTKELEKIYDESDLWTRDYAVLTTKAKAMGVDQIIVCEDGGIYLKNL